MRTNTIKHILLGFFVAYLVYATPHNHQEDLKPEIECVNQNSTELSKKLSNLFEIGIEKILDGIEYFGPAQDKYKSSLFINVSIPKNHTWKIFGNQICSPTFASSNYSNMTPICPSHFVEVVREDLYPFKRQHAVCNCKNRCLNTNETENFVCMPVINVYFVLKRGTCINGTYEWTPGLERVSTFCTCASMYNYG